MAPVQNPIRSMFTNFFRNLKSGKLAIDEFSLFLIILAFVVLTFTIFLNLNRFAFLAWIPLIIAYWRSLSRNRIRRFKENQLFTRIYYPTSSAVKNTYRWLKRKKEHSYFDCKNCEMKLRIPKKTGHVKVTCPKCNHSFVKKTMRGYIKKLTYRVS